MKRSHKNLLSQIQSKGSVAQPSLKITDSAKALLDNDLICVRRTYKEANRDMTEFGMTNAGKKALKT